MTNSYRMLSRAVLTMAGVMVATMQPVPARAQIRTEEITAAVKAAFKTWEDEPCSNVSFEFKGVPDPVSFKINGAIVVYWGGYQTDGSSLWTYEDTPHRGDVEARPGEGTGEIVNAAIAMNAQDYWWSVTDQVEPQTFDIQTAVTRMIPIVLGFYVGTHPSKGANVPWGETSRELSALDIEGVRSLYFEGGDGCPAQAPEKPQACPTGRAPDAGTTPQDAGSASDAGTSSSSDLLCVFEDPVGNPPFHWQHTPIPVYIYIPPEAKLPGGTGQPPAGSGGDAGVSSDASAPKFCKTPDECEEGETCNQAGVCVALNEDGCCRVAHTPRENLAYGLLIVLGLGVFMWNRRRR